MKQLEISSKLPWMSVNTLFRHLLQRGSHHVQHAGAEKSGYDIVWLKHLSQELESEGFSESRLSI